jgi:mannose-6-phosphate isomerase
VEATPRYPLRLEPLFQYRPWGGRRLSHLLSAALPGNGPIGEAWLLSDRADFASRVAEGPCKGKSISQLMEEWPELLLGNLAGRFSRLPLLLKFLDVSKRLSIQVHPSDAHANLLPEGDTGKAEAWIILEAGPAARVFAGFKAPLHAADLRRAIRDGTVTDQLASFTPRPGDAVYIPAGTVHSLSDVVVFEVQQNSDATFRIHDWDQLDPRTGERRPLHLEQAIACIDYGRGAIAPIDPRVTEAQSVRRQVLVQGESFGITRTSGRCAFVVGAAQMPRVVACLSGKGTLEHAGGNHPFRKGDVLLLPASVGECLCRPQGGVSIAEISLPPFD